MFLSDYGEKRVIIGHSKADVIIFGRGRYLPIMSCVALLKKRFFYLYNNWTLQDN